MDLKPSHEIGEASADYAAALQVEHDRYKDMSNVHDLPPIFHYWSNKFVLPIVLEFGGTPADHVFAVYAKYLNLSAKNAGDEIPVFLSIGAGNCDTEVRIARLLKQSGLSRFVIECLELNPAMLDRGRILAAKAGLAQHLEFRQADFNSWAANREYHAVIANHSLHHVLELEHLFDQIKRSLRPAGYFVTNDMIGRNGHQRWPEALTEMQRFWKELPVNYRWNRLMSRYEEEYVNHDCSTEGFEGIRAQDILPLLMSRFDFYAFGGFGNLVDVFTDRAFGPHFNIDAEWDRGFIDRLHEFDEQAILSGALSPTHILAVMTPGPCAEHHYSRGLAPAACLRKPAATHAPDAGSLTITTTSLQRWSQPNSIPNHTLAASGGLPPYKWLAKGLPPGLELGANGFLSGRCRRNGLYPVVVTVTDSSVPTRTYTQRYTVRIDNVTAITSPSELPAGIAGKDYSETLAANGGKPPYSWSVVEGALAPGLALDPVTGSVSGRPEDPGRSAFRLQVTDSAGDIDEADLTLDINPLESGPRYSAVVSQVAAGGGWKTAIHILNPFPSLVSVEVDFYNDDGSPLILPLILNPGDEPVKRQTASLRETIPPYSSLIVATSVETTAAQAGWAEIVASSQVAGYSAFHYRLPDGVPAEVTVPLEITAQPSVSLLYDNTGGALTAVALVNLALSPASVFITAWDQDWNRIAQQDLAMNAHGHASFLLPNRLPTTKGRRGIVQFRAMGEGRLAGFSLLVSSDGRHRATPGLSFTTELRKSLSASS